MTEDPLSGQRFFVTLDPSDAYLPAAQAAVIALVALGGFSEVKGLGGELEVMPYPEGGVNDGVHQLPVRHSWGRITLSGGVGRGPGLWGWYQSGLSQSLGARRDGAIIQLAPDGSPAVAYAFRAGLAASWTGPDLSGLGDAIAIESLQIAHEGLTRVGLPGIG